MSGGRLGSLRDVLLIARFELLRSLRSWQALSLISAYVIANAGAVWLFIRGLAELEAGVAKTLGIAVSKRPGGIMEHLRAREEYRNLLEMLISDLDAVDRMIDVPVLAVFQLSFGLVLVPFLASTNAAETIAGDLRSRAIRFELLRTGRAELLLGRFGGQLLLCLAASAIAVVAVWVLGMTLMAKQDGVLLAWSLASLGLRAVVFSLPFVAMGVAASCATTSPAWGRVLAMFLTAGSWIAYGILSVAYAAPYTWIADLLLPVLPQSSMSALWRPAPSWFASSGMLVLITLGVLGLGFLRLARRDV